MPHCETVSSIKGVHRAPRQDEPRAGTKIHGLYAILRANEGRWVELDLRTFGFARKGKTGYQWSSTVNYMIDNYGLDIRCIRPSQGHLWRWCLAGEWHGRVYIDHIARVQQEDSSTHA